MDYFMLSCLCQADIDLIHTCISRKTMDQRIFQKRLYEQLVDSALHQILIGLHSTDKGIFKSLLLEVYIPLQIFQFIRISTISLLL